MPQLGLAIVNTMVSDQVNPRKVARPSFTFSKTDNEFNKLKIASLPQLLVDSSTEGLNVNNRKNTYNVRIPEVFVSMRQRVHGIANNSSY